MDIIVSVILDFDVYTPFIVYISVNLEMRMSFLVARYLEN